MLRVMPSADWLAIRANQSQSIPWHETVLRPLIFASSEAWVYELKPESAVFQSASRLLRRDQGKYRIDLTGEPITGHELLWNASGGQRGSIALVMLSSAFPAKDIYANCQQAFVVGNASVPHTASAIRFARAKVADGQFICCMLTRTNGFELVSVYAAVPELQSMLLQAQSLVVQRSLYNNQSAA